jgi:hypothetical protein
MSNSSLRSLVPGSNFGQSPVPVLKLFFKILDLAIRVNQPKLVTTSVEWLFDFVNNPPWLFFKKILNQILNILELQSSKVPIP